MRFLFPALLLPLAAVAAPPPVDFSHEILPLLSDACFHCHGPDENKREAKLRLDTKEGLYRTLDGFTVVAPGKPDESELVLRVTSKDRDEIMPPPKAARQLKPEEIALLKRWVAEGAPFGKHWAFEPMKKAAPPGAGDPIDAFVQARLQAAGLDLAPEAGRERLLRRVTFDFTGLPPTLAETDAFLADQSPDAFARVVDRLLTSPRYGERMATEWLDLARFADTHGYQKDAPRPVWPWRDWVIKAFNQNLPYDQFVRQQLAGDLLPNATQEQKLATAFNRLHMQNEEGGIVGEEFRVAYVVDRVNTFGTAFLGLTTECCRCHDHKYDPISQRDFYSLFAFFQNIDEAGQNPFSGFVEKMPEPVLLLASPEQEKRLGDLRDKLAGQAAKWTDLVAQEHATFTEWKKATAAPAAPQPIARFDFEALDKSQTANAIDASKPGKTHEQPELIDGPKGKAALLDGEDGFTFPGVGHFNRTQPFSLSLWIKPGKPAARTVVLHHSKAPEDAASRGYEVLLENGRVAFGLHHYWPTNSLKVTTRTALTEGTWTHLVATYDGSSTADGLHLYLNGAAADVEVVRDSLSKDITYGASEPDLTIGYRFRDSGFKGGAVDEFAVFDRELSALEAAQLADRHEPATDEALYASYLATQSEPARAWRSETAALREEQRKLVEPIPEIMVMRELAQAKPAHILKRGAYDSPGDEVRADTPQVLPPFPADAPRNRLGLAQWLLDPEHPLMARVTVNRLWQQMFGRGLVETAENFGTQGAQPTHPELLDWLARDFVAHGWDVKRTLRSIALSATYRQSSAPGGPNWEQRLTKDPDNRLLSRGTARRLTAEMLRDQALATSGLLAEKLGGPSVKPYQPAGLWEEIAMGKPRYDQGTGTDLHRRSLYTFWKRTVPPPTMVTFDAADRSNCAVRRQSTSTPLQALALLNDVQIVEAARNLAARMLQEGGPSLETQATWAFRTITDRHPSAAELAMLVRLYGEQHDLFAQEPAEATKFLTFGELKSPASLPATDLAAATVLTHTLLNHDEALMRR